MSELKATAGPWGVRRRGGDGQWTIRADTNAGEIQLADVWPADDANGSVVHLPDEANAHLIAAAPELYEALALFVRAEKMARDGNAPQDADRLIELGDAALAKARGEQSA